MPREQEVNPDFISREEAYANALIEAAKFMLSEATEPVRKNTTFLNAKAIEIYDINGSLLFYDFVIESGKSQLGTVRAIAQKSMGTPVISIRFGPQKWNLLVSKRAISEILAKKFSGFKVGKSVLVCYSYPKLGLQVSLTNDKGSSSVIFDVSSFDIIPAKPEKENVEGTYAWSFLDSIDKRTKTTGLKRYNKAAEVTKSVFTKELGPDIYRISDLYMVTNLAKLVFKTRNEKKIQFCTHYRHDEAGSHHCFILHAQQVNDYCSVATCQMILCYFRYYYSQVEIAPALGYSAGGGCPADVSAGYESLSNNHLKASYDPSPTWNKARDQINLLQPMKSGVPGHARAIAGYSNNIFVIQGASTADKKLYVYDPWPWNADLKAGGDIYWEDWDSITHTNFVNTELDY